MYNPIHNIRVSRDGRNLIFTLKYNSETTEFTDIAIQSCASFREISPTAKLEDIEKSLIVFLDAFSYADDITSDELYFEIPLSALRESNLRTNGLYFITVFMADKFNPDNTWNETQTGFDYNGIYDSARHLALEASAKCDWSNKSQLLDLYWRKTAVQMAIDMGD